MSRKCSYLVILVKQGRIQDCVGRGMIPCRHDKERSHNAPFGDIESEKEKAEFQRYYQVGRMGVLFNLVSIGLITIYDAADFAGLTLEEAVDMLQGWREAQAMG